jgi:hypothetical protein
MAFPAEPEVFHPDLLHLLANDAHYLAVAQVMKLFAAFRIQAFLEHWHLPEGG